jgi:Flp pilus assembly protein TadG
MRPAGNISRQRRGRETGAALVEFAFVILPSLGFLFLLMNLAWMIFAWACVQEGAREGVRAAVTCSPSSGLNAAVQSVVQTYSFGFINAQNASSLVTVRYYRPPNFNLVSTKITSGDVVNVSVSGLSLGIFSPILFTASPVYLGASSADVMSCATPATP